MYVLYMYTLWFKNVNYYSYEVCKKKYDVVNNKIKLSARLYKKKTFYSY